MNALKQGFQDILPLDSIKVFDEKEVEVSERKGREGMRRNCSFFAFSCWSVAWEKSISMIGERIRCIREVTHQIIQLFNGSGRWETKDRIGRQSLHDSNVKQRHENALADVLFLPYVGVLCPFSFAIQGTSKVSLTILHWPWEDILFFFLLRHWCPQIACFSPFIRQSDRSKPRSALVSFNSSPEHLDYRWTAFESYGVPRVRRCSRSNAGAIEQSCRVPTPGSWAFLRGAFARAAFF